jgi:hypothetical protein
MFLASASLSRLRAPLLRWELSTVKIHSSQLKMGNKMASRDKKLNCTPNFDGSFKVSTFTTLKMGTGERNVKIILWDMG